MVRDKLYKDDGLMASVLLSANNFCARSVERFDCPCGGLAVIKAWAFKNKWRRKNSDGAVLQAISRYYAQCLTCGEVTNWRFSPEEAKTAMMSGDVIKGEFGRDGKYKIKK